MRIQANRSLWSDTIDIHMADRLDDGLYVYEVIQRTKITNGHITEPFLRLSIEDAQELSNKLYAVGIQPSKLNGSVGQLEATNKHLEDMRTLVFNK